MNIVSRVLTTPECGIFLPLAMNRARELFRVLERDGKKIGARRYEVKQGRQGYYIDIRIQMPNVWILIDTKKCPGFVSGLVWVKDYFEPVITVDEVDYLRTLFPRATPTTQADSAELASNGSQILTLRAGMFSGEMRKVVQVLLGMDVGVPYSPSSSVTHGVYAASNDARWIIKISRDGVFAWPMMACYGKNNPTGLEYTPLPTPEPEEPLELISGEEMTEALQGKGAFYSGCGWAFSESGRKAANCFVGSEDMYSYSWQYQITITPDPETGAPISASLALLSEGYIHGPKTSHMKYPRSDAPTALYSFDPYRGNANYVHDCAAPVFCYFDGESLQTYYYVHAVGSDVQRADTFIPDGRSSLCSEFVGVTLYEGNFAKVARSFIRLNSTSPFYRIRDARDTFTLSLAGPFGIGAESTTFTEDPSVCEVWQTVRDYVTGRDEITDGVSVLIVTGYDREAAYLATSLTSSSAGVRSYGIKNSICKATCSYTNLDPCLATGDLRSIAIQVTGYVGYPYTDDSCQSGIRYGSVVGYFVVPGASIGSVINWREQRGSYSNSCFNLVGSITEFYAANSANVPYYDTDFPSHSETSYRVSLRGSDGFRAAVEATDSQIGDWLQFITQGMNDQTAQILRDAFVPTRAAYSTSVNRTRGFELKETAQFAPYDLSTVTGSTLAFVGVP